MTVRRENCQNHQATLHLFAIYTHSREIYGALAAGSRGFSAQISGCHEFFLAQGGESH